MLTGDSLDAVTVESGKVRYLPMWVDFGLRGCCKQNMSCTKVDRGNGFRDFLLDMFLDFFVGLNFSMLSLQSLQLLFFTLFVGLDRLNNRFFHDHFE